MRRSLAEELRPSHARKMRVLGICPSDGDRTVPSIQKNSNAISLMWCTDCQQDVPAIASRDVAQGVNCARCGAALSGATEDPLNQTDATGLPNSLDEKACDQDSAPSPDPHVAESFDDWELDEQLYRAEQLAQSLRQSSRPTTFQRVDPSHSAGEFSTFSNLAAGRHETISRPVETSAVPPEASPTKTRTRTQRGSYLSWPFLAMGLMSLVCGGVLLGWAMVQRRADLWTLGLPLVLAGQAGMLLGFLLQIDRLRHNARLTCEAVNRLEEELHQLRSVTPSHAAPERTHQLPT